MEEPNELTFRPIFTLYSMLLKLNSFFESIRLNKYQHYCFGKKKNNEQKSEPIFLQSFNRRG